MRHCYNFMGQTCDAPLEKALNQFNGLTVVSIPHKVSESCLVFPLNINLKLGGPNVDLTANL